MAEAVHALKGLLKGTSAAAASMGETGGTEPAGSTGAVEMSMAPVTVSAPIVKTGEMVENSKALRRKQNNEAARRFREKRKVVQERAVQELAELKVRERGQVLLLNKALKFIRTNPSVDSFAELQEDLERAIGDYLTAYQLVSLEGLEDILAVPPAPAVLSGTSDLNPAQNGLTTAQSSSSSVNTNKNKATGTVNSGERFATVDQVSSLSKLVELLNARLAKMSGEAEEPSSKRARTGRNDGVL